ncbi:MAG: 2-oxo acid dehydrogenase subunit E2, partial [Aquificota bacterium]
MDYEITMPKLTDTMESGLIVRWLKDEGEYIEKGEPIVEVETEKAIQEVPVFKSGIIKKIVANEGDEVPVGKPIAILEITEEKPKTEKKEVQEVIKKKQPKKEKKLEYKEEKVKIEEVKKETIKLPEGAASPAAKKLASELNIDIKTLQEKEKLPTPAHEEDILTYYYSKYFEIDAIKEAKAYNIDLKELVNRYKNNITKEKVIKYAKENNLYK